jgi:uncharacterized phosphosugar-binding protein
VVKRVPSPGRRLPVPVTGDGALTRDSGARRSETGAFNTLTAIAADETASQTARVSASRTLLEAAGRIGAGRQAPDGDAVLSVATRAALEAELTRLRSACFGPAKRNASVPKA